MCDDATESENDELFSRRAVGRLGAAAVVGGVLAGCGAAEDAKAASPAFPAPKQRVRAAEIKVPTPDGTADAYFVHPAKGKHPAVILWPDVAGLRPAYKTMADRLAGDGYAVLAVNHYYRGGPAPVLSSFAEWRSEAGQAKLKPMIAALNPATIASDSKAFIAWLAGRREVDQARKLANIGYCMTGSFTFRAAAAAPDRTGAIGSFHGGGLATDKPDSPHLLFPDMRAAALIAIAQNDDAREPQAKDILRKAAADAGRTAEIEVYPAQHGWCTIDSPVYDPVQAERAWQRMLALFSKSL